MITPKNLYHYTNINSLALILSTRNIRFSALNQVNDTGEGKSADLGDFGMYIFVSCWTISEQESLPIWNMYTNQMRGVRIMLPYPIFPMHNFQGHDSLFSVDDMITHNYIIISGKNLCHNIIYTQEKSKLVPDSLRKINDHYDGIYMDELGLYKEEIWSFEQEFRFKFSVIPKPKTEFPKDSFDLNELTEIIDRRKSLGFSQYDLRISDQAFDRMEIVLGPKLQSGDREIVQALIAKYNPNAKVHESSLKGKVR